MRELLFEGPETPPGGGLYCIICCMLYKQQALEQAYPDVVREAATTDGPPIVVDLRKYPDGITDARSFPAAAAGYGWFFPMAPPPNGNGMLPLPAPMCWTHLMGLTVNAGGIAQASAQDMAMLSGQVPLLYGKR